MKTTHHRSFWLLVAMTINSSALTGRAVGDIQGQYNNVSGEYSYAVTNLPDFDQQRASFPPSFVGLPNNGLMYCVPTSTMNVLAYIANHGFPTVTPGVGNWQTAALYNPAGTAIANMGARMNTDPNDGTDRDGWYFGIVGHPLFGTLPPAVPLDKISVYAYFKHDSYVPRFTPTTEAAIFHNGLVAFCHGWYQVSGYINGVPVVARDGGHCMTLEKVKGCGPCVDDVKVRDPGDDDLQVTQSQFASAKYQVAATQVCESLGPVCIQQTMSQFIPAPPSNGPPPPPPPGALPGPPDELRLLDGVILMCTKSGYSFTFDPDFSYISFLKPITFGSDVPAVQSFLLPKDAFPVVDVVITPDFDGFMYIADNEVYRLNPLTRNSDIIEFFPEFKVPLRLMFGRNRGLYVLDSDVVYLFDVDQDPPVSMSAAAPPNPVIAMTFDDRTDEVVMLSTFDRVLLRYEWMLEGEPVLQAIPPEVPLDDSSSMAINPADGSIWLSSNNYDGVWRLEADEENNVSAQGFALPAVQSPHGVEVDDAGHVFVVAGGTVHEFVMQNGTLVPPNPISPFAGLPAGPSFKLTHSRTNFEPGVHDTPEWRDVFPTQFAPVEPDCLADIAPPDGDGTVNIDDLFAVVAAWGPCAGCGPDIAPAPGGNSAIDIDDLFTVIAAWGPCPEEAVFLASNNCLTPQSVTAGTYEFSTEDATTDGPPLPGSCNEGFGLSFENDIWMQYLPSFSGSIVVTTCGSANYDTRLAAYIGQFCNELILIACNDDGPGCSGFTSTMVVPVNAGVPVRIRLGGFGGAAGNGTVTIASN